MELPCDSLLLQATATSFCNAYPVDISSEWPDSAGEAWFQVPQVTREGPEVRWYISAWYIGTSHAG